MAPQADQIIRFCECCYEETPHSLSFKKDRIVKPTDGAFSPVAQDFGIFYDLYRCSRCGHISSLLEIENLLESYRKAEDTGDYYLNWEFRERNLEQQFQKILQYIQTENPVILDLGAGGGIFLNLLKKYGYRGKGVEPSTSLTKAAREKFQVDIEEGTLKTLHLTENFYDLITLFEVIEHFENPSKEVGAAIKLLKSGGYILIVTPNVKSLSSKILGRKWWSYRQMHIHYFSPGSLDQMMGKFKCKLVYSGVYLKSFPLKYYLKKLNPDIAGIISSINLNLKVSLGDMVRLYRKQ